MDSLLQKRGVQPHKTFSGRFLSLSWQGEQEGWKNPEGRAQPTVPHLD